MNIKIFNYDLPADLDLSDEKEVALDNEALGLVLGRDPLTLVQIGLKSKNFFLIKLNRNNYNKELYKKFKNIQLPLNYKKKKSQFIIKNDFTDKSVKRDIKRILKIIL